MLKKTCKLLCTLAVAGMLTLSLSGIGMADAPGDYAPVKKVSKKRGELNYPAFLFPRGQGWEHIYTKLQRPAVGYNFDLVPLASRNFVPVW